MKATTVDLKRLPVHGKGMTQTVDLKRLPVHTPMKTKDKLVKEALVNMTDKKLDEMKQNFETVLAEMASEALEQRRTEIAREFVA